MSRFGGGTKFGGGAHFGGAPSVYEQWRIKMFDWTGDGTFDRHYEDSTANIYKLFSVIGGAHAGAENDAERIRSEGIPAKSIETLHEWELIFNVINTDVNDDCKRVLLGALMANAGSFTSTARIDAVAEDFLESAATGDDTNAYVHSCTMAQCTATDNSGDGVRYVAVLVPEWVWLRAREYWRALQEWCDRSDDTGSETTVCFSNSGSPMNKDLPTSEPAFYCNCRQSLIDRDVVRN